MAESNNLDYIVEDTLEIGRFDGWLAVFLLGSLIFGPRTSPGGSLPPIRFDDFVILFMVLARWGKANRYYGGFLFSGRARLFSRLTVLLAGLLVFSTLINTVTGRYSFYIKDMFQPIVFVRLALVAAIMASFNYGECQIKQLAKGIILMGVLAGTLALLQKFKPYLVAGVVERFYSIEYTRLEIETTGTLSRVVGTFGNPNLFGACLTMLAISLLSIAIHLKSFIRWVAMSLFLTLAAIIVITTASRTAFVALAFTSFLALLLSMKGASRIWLVFLMILMVIGFFIFRANIDRFSLNERIRDMVAGKSIADESLVNRFSMWRRDIGEAQESILFGVGASKQRNVISDNGYVCMLRFTGIIGLGTYLVLLIGLLIQGIKAFFVPKTGFENATVLMCLMILVNHMLYDVTADFFWSVQYSAIFAAFMGILGAMSAQIREQHCYASEDEIEEGHYPGTIETGSYDAEEI